MDPSGFRCSSWSPSTSASTEQPPERHLPCAGASSLSEALSLALHRAPQTLPSTCVFIVAEAEASRCSILLRLQTLPAAARACRLHRPTSSIESIASACTFPTSRGHQSRRGSHPAMASTDPRYRRASSVCCELPVHPSTKNCLDVAMPTTQPTAAVAA